MSNYSTRPRILFVTPEATFLPERTGNRTHHMGVCSGSFGDFPTQLISDLLNLGVDVHVAQPDYRKLFEILSRNQQANPSIELPMDRLHLAEDRSFFYSKPINCNNAWENLEISLNFQREVINQIAPRVQPDLIHCHDWMTGLIPAAAGEYEMPCLFTVQTAESAKSLLANVEDRGIDAAAFWRNLFYDRFPDGYEETRATNPLDLLLSGILAARYVETANFMLLPNAASYDSQASYTCLRQVLAEKSNAGCACAMAGIPDSATNTTSEKARYCKHGPNQQLAGKQKKEPVMGRSTPWFDHWETTYHYVDLYEKILQQPLVAPEEEKAPTINKNGLTKASDSQTVSYRKAWSTNPHVLSNEQIPNQAMAPM
ncbi:MAG: glycogen/starch synthase [Desulfobacterales bacterium]